MTNNLTSDKTFNLGMPVSVLLFIELCIFWITYTFWDKTKENGKNKLLDRDKFVIFENWPSKRKWLPRRTFSFLFSAHSDLFVSKKLIANVHIKRKFACSSWSRSSFCLRKLYYIFCTA